jgi:hypothetical protein
MFMEANGLRIRVKRLGDLGSRSGLVEGRGIVGVKE